MSIDMLMSAILESPDDDQPRLAYADWLEQHDDADRAEFIRIQCELALIERDDPRADALRSRNHELLCCHGEEWAADVAGRGVRKVRFHRGLIEELTTTAHAFITRGDSWTTSMPLRKVRLTSVVGRADRLAACRHLSSITDLTLSDSRATDNDVAAVVGSPFLTSLTSLAVRASSDFGIGPQVGDEGLRSLAAASFYGHLTSLSIASDGSIGSDGVEALAAAEETALEEMHLSFGSVDDRGASALANARGLVNLACLSLDANRIGDEGLIALATSRHLPNLARLWLTANQVRGTALVALANARCARSLEHLNIEQNPVDAVDVNAVATIVSKNPDLTLNLSGCLIPRPVQETLDEQFRGRVWVDRVRPKSALSISG